MAPHKEQQPPKLKSEAQLWSRLRKLKERKVRVIAEYGNKLAQITAEIDAEIEVIKSTLGNVLSEQ
jgi:hypothetical protein